MRRWAVVAAVGLGGLTACTLLTDLDGFTTPTSKSIDGGAGNNDANAPPVVETKPEAGVPDPSCAAATETDPHNCGRCGKDCLGGACTAGQCGAAVLAKGFEHVLGVGISQGKLYVGQDGALVELSLDGKGRKHVVKDVSASYVWGTDTDVFFTNTNADAILRWPHTVDGTTQLVVGAPGVSGVAVSPTHVYYTRYAASGSGGGVYRVPYPTPGAPEELKVWDHPESVAWADGKIYFAGDGENTANSLTEDGTVDKLLEGGGPTGIFVLGDDAFITRQHSGELLHVSITTKKYELLLEDLAGPSGVVATADAVYWVELDSGNLGVLVR